jgi:hypothetical protein
VFIGRIEPGKGNRQKDRDVGRSIPMAANHQGGRQDVRQDDNGNGRRRPPQSDLEDERDAKRTKLRTVLNPADCNLGIVFDTSGCIGINSLVVFFTCA